MALSEKLDVWKKDLIDMSRRNTLLYYRLEGPRPSGLSLQDANIGTLYEDLIKRRRSVTEHLLCLPDPETNPLPLKRLERLRVQARDDMKERGVQSLYMVFGLLEWYEAAHSEEPVRSPILLVPVAISRGGAGARYSLNVVEDEDIEINPTLTEWLRMSFHLSLPTYHDIIQGVQSTDAEAGGGANQAQPSDRQRSRPSVPSLEQVFAAVDTAIEALPPPARHNWSIRRELYLGRFSFQKLVMRQDLERHQQEALAHPMLRRLAGERGALKDPDNLVTIDQLDTRVQPAETLEILDADSSQQEAIQAAKAGQSFVLQGPPGTGKSQTIANIIAESLGQGKTVLFVSEKMAALDVVRKRLQAAGLGEFLLDLHDTKQNKREFVDELNQVVQQARHAPELGVAVQWQRDSEALRRRRDQLNEYVRELHAKRFALDISAYEAYGRLARLAAAQASDAVLADDVQIVSAAQLEHMREVLRQLLDYRDVLDSYRTHPWQDTILTSLSNEQSTAIEHHFDRLSQILADAESGLRQLAVALGEQDASITFDWASYACDRTQLALGSPLPPAHWFQVETVERLRPLLAYACGAAAEYHAAHRVLDQQYDAAIYQLNHQTLLEALMHEAQSVMDCLSPRGAQDKHDLALRQRQEFEQHLTENISLLHRMAESANRVADTLGLPPPARLDDVATLLPQAQVVAESPTPPRTWLDPETYPEARITALDLIDKAMWVQQARAGFSAHYLPAFLDADLHLMATRFREQYDSFLRYIRPQFYLDMRTLRRFLKPGAVRTADEFKGDVTTAIKLHETEQWLSEHHADLARLLGRRYNGELTDWAEARKLVEWADAFHTVFAQNMVMDTIHSLITGPVGARAALVGALESLVVHWQMWGSGQAWLSTSLHTQSLLDGEDDTHRPHVLAYARALERLLRDLRQYWQAADQISALRKDTATPEWSDLVECLTMAQAVRTFETWVATNERQLQADLGADFQGIVTNWEQARVNLDWVENLAQFYPEGVPEALVAWIARGDGVSQRRTVIKETRTTVLEYLRVIEDELHYVESAVIPRARLSRKGLAHGDTPLTLMRQRVDALRKQMPLLARWVMCGQRIMDCRALGLGTLIESGLERGSFPQDIIPIFERRFYSLWLDAAHAQSPALKRFSGKAQERIVQQFRQLDREHIQIARRQLVMLLRKRRYDTQKRAASAAQSQVIEERAFGKVYDQLVREAQKKRSPAIREIVRKVQGALIELKPCWMMSPLTVSQFVATAVPVFDLVIFDEASQVLTEDAICAILRGKQLIVVGDEKQLPPTSFFTKSLADEGDDEDEEAVGESAEQERTESILKEMLSANVTPRSLKWHYRSQHESLIAFSNSQFYDGQLITFPGPAAHHRDGVRFNYVADGVYDYGGSRTNRREAERVVDLVLQLAQSHPDASLGVVALSGAQQNAIREALDTRFRQNPELEAMRNKLNEDSADENAFFIKNLESVQGDERDIILLSIGYGPDRTGKVHATFGPVNRKGGERRLNVAVTRARQRLYVVSSLHASDISPTQSVGVQTLRRYLDYAERGPVALTLSPTAAGEVTTDIHFDSPFEQTVYDALTAKGMRLDTQIGCSGYRIDLAARDLEQPDRYVLGIECDGRSYHSSKTARDRDRLRQAHLESLGWTIHRIWSSDWYAHPEREIEKTLTAFTDARQKIPPTMPTERVS